MRHVEQHVTGATGANRPEVQQRRGLLYKKTVVTRDDARSAIFLPTPCSAPPTTALDPSFDSGDVHSGRSCPSDPTTAHAEREARRRRVFHSSSTEPIPRKNEARWRRVGNATPRLKKGDVRSWRHAGSPQLGDDRPEFDWGDVHSGRLPIVARMPFDLEHKHRRRRREGVGGATGQGRRGGYPPFDHRDSIDRGSSPWTKRG